ncbi:E3 ubiquitin-protein ligase TRIM39-like isoform X2 [Protopterus annectens]|uniref:E3 ubiquitin-protein ligase TRIM39-like isoform X2 n=1 Tax=Protopterus annectens TaxID=7888 RepID=UPI001CF952E7|nr:E3 ubiquitin-protein ligase TRIM39-like isoform X2 [Protopterus annectens]
MAEKENLELLKREASCPVCLDFFNDPVMTDCGHNFCKQCIDTCWVGSERNVTCPECRAVLLGQHTLRVNRKLANMVEVARRLNDNREKCDKDTMCCAHQQPLQLFCENDAKFLCVVCGLSKEHKRHKVLPMEEAVEDYKEKLEHSLNSLRKQIKMNRKSKIEEERKIQELQKNAASVRQRIITEFEQLHNFLNEQQHFFLAKLEHEEKRIKDILNENLKKLSEMNYEINRLTLEIEDKLRSQDKDLLMAIGDTFERCDMDFHINNMTEGLCIKECSFPLQYTVWKRMLKAINPGGMQPNGPSGLYKLIMLMPPLRKQSSTAVCL